MALILSSSSDKKLVKRAENETINGTTPITYTFVESGTTQIATLIYSLTGVSGTPSPDILLNDVSIKAQLSVTGTLHSGTGAQMFIGDISVSAGDVLKITSDVASYQGGAIYTDMA